MPRSVFLFRQTKETRKRKKETRRRKGTLGEDDVGRVELERRAMDGDEGSELGGGEREGERHLFYFFVVTLGREVGVGVFHCGKALLVWHSRPSRVIQWSLSLLCR